jgi:hypothetical protein
MNAKFTPRRKYFRIGASLLPVFLGMLLFSVVGMYFDAPPDRRWLAVVLVAVIWGCMVALSAYLILAYRKEATILNDSAVRFVRILTDQTILLTDVRRARWYCYGRPWRLKLVAQNCKRTIWFDNFYPDQTAQIVRYFRERLDPSVQEGWDDSLARSRLTCTRAELRSGALAYLRRLSVKVAVLGPILGLLCGVVLYLIALRMEVPAPTWSGSVFLDWTLYGLLTSAVLLAGIWWCIWIEWPEDSPPGDRP